VFPIGLPTVTARGLSHARGQPQTIELIGEVPWHPSLKVCRSARVSRCTVHVRRGSWLSRRTEAGTRSELARSLGRGPSPCADGHERVRTRHRNHAPVEQRDEPAAVSQGGSLM